MPVTPLIQRAFGSYPNPLVCFSLYSAGWMLREQSPQTLEQQLSTSTCRQKDTRVHNRDDGSYQSLDFSFGPLLQIVYQDEGLTICSDVGVPAESSENLAQEGQPLHCLCCGALGGRKAATDGGKCILD